MNIPQTVCLLMFVRYLLRYLLFPPQIIWVCPKTTPKNAVVYYHVPHSWKLVSWDIYFIFGQKIEVPKTDKSFHWFPRQFHAVAPATASWPSNIRSTSCEKGRIFYDWSEASGPSGSTSLVSLSNLTGGSLAANGVRCVDGVNQCREVRIVRLVRVRNK